VILMELEGIMLSEISQTEKGKYCMISYMEPKKNQTHTKQRTDWWLPEVGSKELGKWVKMAKGTNFQL